MADELMAEYLRLRDGEFPEVRGREPEDGGQRTGVTQVEHPEGARFNRAGWAGTEWKYLTHVEAFLCTL